MKSFIKNRMWKTDKAQSGIRIREFPDIMKPTNGTENANKNEINFIEMKTKWSVGQKSMTFSRKFSYRNAYCLQ